MKVVRVGEHLKTHSTPNASSSNDTAVVDDCGGTGICVQHADIAVSYTHLTLPTIYSV